MKTCVSNPFSSVNQTAARYVVLLTLVSISCAFPAHAQNRAALYGQVRIAAEPQDFPIQGASISLVRKSDGSTVLRTSSDQHGLFRIARWDAETQLLRITYLGLQTATLNLPTQANDTLRITLQPESISLEEVSILRRKQLAILRGDTLEYAAADLQWQQYDQLETLTDQIPGISIDVNGKLLLFGRPLNRILLDGQPYFVSDPISLLKLLPAGMVDKIQIFDEKDFFGNVTDPTHVNKMLNITTRADRSRSSFGLAGLSGSPQNYYHGHLNGSVWRDQHRTDFIGSSNSFNSMSASMGQPFSVSTLGRLANLSQGTGDFHSLHGNYSGTFSRQRSLTMKMAYILNNTLAESNSMRQYLASDLLGQTALQERELESQRRTIIFNSMFGNGDMSKHRYSLMADIQAEPRDIRSLSGLQTTLNDVLLNTSESQNQEKSNQFKSEITGFYHLKWGENNRHNLHASLLSTVRLENNHHDQLNHADYYGSAGIRQDTLQQFRREGTWAYGFVPKIRYETKLASATHLTFAYTNSNGNTNHELLYFFPDQQTWKTRQELDSLASNAYKTHQSGNSLDAHLSQRIGAFSFHLRPGYRIDNIRNTNSWQPEDRISQTYHNWLPQGSISYGSGTNWNLFIFTLASTLKLPMANQLAESFDLRNPMMVSVGNRQLRAEKGHDIGLRYQGLSSNFSRRVEVVVNYHLHRNLISEAVSTITADSLLPNGFWLGNGAMIRQPINIAGALPGWSAKLDVSWPILNNRLQLQYGLTGNTENRPILVNDVLQKVKIHGLTHLISIREQLTPLRANIVYRHSLNQSARMLNRQSSIITHDITGNFRYALRPKLELHTQFSYRHNTITAMDRSFPLLLLNPAIAYKPLKDARAELILSAFDLFDRSQYDRATITDFYMENLQSNSIGRFFMLTFNYKFERLGL